MEESQEIKIASRGTASGGWFTVVLPAILVVLMAAIGLLFKKSKAKELEELDVEEIVEEGGIGVEELEI